MLGDFNINFWFINLTSPTKPRTKDRVQCIHRIGRSCTKPLCFEETVGSKSKQHPITNISEWLQAFAVYVPVMARKQPQRVPHLMGYQILMLEASNKYQSDCWLGYYRNFRQQAASLPNFTWSNMNSTIWNLAFTGQGRANGCRHCFSLFHLSKDCEFASN